MTDILQRSWKYPTEQEINSQILKTQELECSSNLVGPKVVKVEYDKYAFLMTLVLDNSTKITFSPYIISALKKASHTQLDDVCINNSGENLCWNSLNFSIYTNDLIKFVTNCKNTI